MAKAGSRKKVPKFVAVINADNCTGCESCLEVCPVDCIYKVPGETISVLQPVPPRSLGLGSSSSRPVPRSFCW